MESVLTIAPPSRSAISIATADLPLAVGPAIRIASLSRPPPSSRMGSSMPLVATLISHPAERAVKAPLLDMASRTLKATEAHWLAPEIACDLRLPEGAEPRRGARPARGPCRAARRPGHPACRGARQAPAARRHGLDHDRPGVHRRTRRRSRPEGPCRRDHGAVDEWRDRVRAGAARARRAAEGPGGRR